MPTDAGQDCGKLVDHANSFRRQGMSFDSDAIRPNSGETCQPMTMKTRCCCNPSRPWCQAPHLSSGLSSVVLPVNYTDLCMR